MSVRYAINGLGRIGRALFRVAWDRPGLELVAVNDLGSAAQLANLLARDSVHGPFDRPVVADGDDLVVDGRRVRVCRSGESGEIPWLELEPEVVVDATGLASDRASAEAHRRGSVRKVLISGNADGLDHTVCIGVNHATYDPVRHDLLSAGSCTTNCLAPVASVLERDFGIRSGLLNTVHSYNNDQRLLSFPHRDPRRARAAALNMIPTTTSAIRALGRVMPELAGRIEGFAIRVPTPNVSLIDLVAELETPTDVEAVNASFERAVAEDSRGILGVTREELVSSDFLGDPRSAVVDLPLTQIAGDGLVRVVAWYDNEWGHASRMADLLELVGGGA